MRALGVSLAIAVIVTLPGLIFVTLLLHGPEVFS